MFRNSKKAKNNNKRAVNRKFKVVLNALLRFQLISNKYDGLCGLAFSGMGEDKIPPPHQVGRTQ